MSHISSLSCSLVLGINAIYSLDIILLVSSIVWSIFLAANSARNVGEAQEIQQVIHWNFFQRVDDRKHS